MSHIVSKILLEQYSLGLYTDFELVIADWDRSYPGSNGFGVTMMSDLRPVLILVIPKH